MLHHSLLFPKQTHQVEGMHIPFVSPTELLHGITSLQHVVPGNLIQFCSRRRQDQLAVNGGKGVTNPVRIASSCLRLGKDEAMGFRWQTKDMGRNSLIGLVGTYVRVKANIALT